MVEHGNHGRAARTDDERDNAATPSGNSVPVRVARRFPIVGQGCVKSVYATVCPLATGFLVGYFVP